MSPHDPPRLRAVESQEGEPRGDEEEREAEEHEARRGPGSARQGFGLGDAEEDGEEDEGHRDGRQHQRERDVAAEGGEDASTRQRTDDGPGLERHDEESRGPAGLRGPGAGAPTPLEDERDLEREPHDVEALQRPGGEERPEVPGDDEPPAGAGRQHGRDEEDPLVAEHVAELREDGDDECRQQQLRGLEPVEVRVVDAQVLDEVGDERDVVALQDAARDLDEEQPADEPCGDARCRPTDRRPPSGRRGSAGRRAVSRHVGMVQAARPAG